MTIIRRLNVSQVDGNGANDTNANEIRPYGEIGLYQGDNNKLELLMFDGVRTHVKSKVLNKGTFYGGDADSGDGLGYDSIKLVPDESLRRGGSQQYLIIEPTGGSPGHVHIRAGGTIDNSGADLFLGGEKNHVKVSDTLDNVVISTDDNNSGTKQWTFAGNGTLTFPATEDGQLFLSGSEIAGVGNNSVALSSNTSVVINTYDPNPHSWNFGNDGTITFPNNALVDSADSNIEFRGMNNFNVEAGGVVNIVTDSSDDAYSWQFGDDGTLTVPGNITKTSGNLEITAENYVIIDSTNGGQIDIGANQADGTPNSATILVGHAGNTLQIAAGKLRINATTPPTHSTGAVGDVAGLVAFSSGYLYYCTADYGQTGHQIVVATLYNGGTSINSNSIQLTKTSDTLQITVGDIISDSDGGATSVVGTVSHDANYTYIGTGAGGGVAYNCVFPLTFTSTDYVSGGNIWKRVAWSGDTW